MPSAIVTTVGATNANSYVDLVAAEAYFDNLLSASSWSAATSDDRTRALLVAAQRLNNENWQGNRAKKDQALAWPRAGVIKPDGLGPGSIDFIPGAGAALYPRTGYVIYWGGYGEQFPSTEIPQPIKDAQCELALALLEGFGDASKAAIDSFSADGVSVDIQSSGPVGVLPSRVSQLLAGLVSGNVLVRS